MIKCPKDGWVPVPEKDLPITLPEVEAYEPTDDGKSPLSKITDWVKTTCPVCGGEGERETDTMPNWAGSDWYFLRYLDPHNDTFIASPELLKKWLPVDVYVGGDEHNTLHLLYSRFIYKFLYDLGYMPKEHPEPYFRRLSHGVILGTDNNRMSKSHGNVIVPEVVADIYGVDVIRMYQMFMGPFDGTMAWNEKTLMGVKRFLDRLEKLVYNHTNDESASSQKVLMIINKLIKGVEEDIGNFKFNTAIAKMMEASNNLEELKEEIGKPELRAMSQIIAPFAPYMAEEMWQKLGGEGSVHISSWPKFEEKYLTEEKLKIAVAVNGKLRDTLEIDKDRVDDKALVIAKAKESQKLLFWIKDKKILNEIYVSGRMLNIVVA